MKKEGLKIYQVYFTNSWDDSENKERYYKTEENAQKKYKQLCKKYGLKTIFCFSDNEEYCVWYWTIHIED